MTVVLLEILQAGGKPPTDDQLGNIVTALAHPLGHARNSGFRIGQTQEKQANTVALRSP